MRSRKTSFLTLLGVFAKNTTGDGDMIVHLVFGFVDGDAAHDPVLVSGVFIGTCLIQLDLGYLSLEFSRIVKRCRRFA